MKLLQVINIITFVYNNDKYRLIVMKYGTVWRNYCYSGHIDELKRYNPWYYVLAVK